MNTMYWQETLEALKNMGQLRQMKLINGPQTTHIEYNSKTFLNFCSNNYLGLADDQRIIDAATKAMQQFGFGSGASRLVCGNMAAHETLEENIAALKKQPAALLFNSGFAANSGVIPALMGREDIIFSDKLNHASIVDGCLLSRSTVRRFAHADLTALEEELKTAPTNGKRMIVTDTVFSMDGDLAPLKEIVDLAKRYEAFVYVDEAHAFGVLGENGAGLVERLGLEQDIDVQMGTLSKAAGCFGAYVAGSQHLRAYLVNHARSFIYTTGLPPMLAAAAAMSVDIIRSEEGKKRRLKLDENSRYVRQALKDIGFDVRGDGTPIIPVIIKDSAKALAMSAQLLNKNIYVSAIRTPTVPANTARLRLTVMATHTQEDLNQLINAMKGL